MKNTENIRIDELLTELQGLREAKDSLERDNDFLQRQNSALRFRCATYSRKNMELEAEIRDMKFTRDYLTSEDAGKAFARELLGKPMTPEDLAEERAIAEGEAHYERTWNINCGDDF